MARERLIIRNGQPKVVQSVYNQLEQGNEPLTTRGAKESARLRLAIRRDYGVDLGQVKVAVSEARIARLTATAAGVLEENLVTYASLNEPLKQPSRRDIIDMLKNGSKPQEILAAAEKVRRNPPAGTRLHRSQNDQ